MCALLAAGCVQNFIVDIGAPFPAQLPMLSFEGATRRNRPNLNSGAHTGSHSASVLLGMPFVRMSMFCMLACVSLGFMLFGWPWWPFVRCFWYWPHCAGIADTAATDTVAMAGAATAAAAAAQVT